MSEPTVFATLRRSRRIWAVASIHGEATRLAALHDELAQRLHQGDRIVYLGNYLGRGPGVRSTLDQLIDFRRWVIAQPGMFAADVVFRSDFTSATILLALSWLFQKSAAPILSSSSLRREILAGKSKRVPDGDHPG